MMVIEPGFLGQKPRLHQLHRIGIAIRLSVPVHSVTSDSGRLEDDIYTLLLYEEEHLSGPVTLPILQGPDFRSGFE